MGIESWIHKPVTIFGYTLRNRRELDDAINEAKEQIEDAKKRISQYVFMTEPKKFIPDNQQDNVVGYLERELEELFELYDEARINLTRLWEFEEDWNKTHDKDGRSILPVDPFMLNKVYMGGDYADSVLEDGSDVPDDYWDVYHGFVKPEECSFKHIYANKITTKND